MAVISAKKHSNHRKLPFKRHFTTCISQGAPVEEQVMNQSCDFLVIGSGIAGLSYALHAAQFGTVLMITKKKSPNRIPTTHKVASPAFWMQTIPSKVTFRIH